MEIYLVDAFTDKKFGGNPAGVVLDADRLSREDKQKIASEIHASETAFAGRSEVADFKVEFFTPLTEIDFCGHATVAMFHTLARTGRITLGGEPLEMTEETRAGIIPVSVEKKNGIIFVSIRQTRARFEAVPLRLFFAANSILAASSNCELKKTDMGASDFLKLVGILKIAASTVLI